MKAVVWEKYGAAKYLKLKDIEKPVPKDNQILIKIHATSVNAGDCEMRSLKFALFLKVFIRAYFGLVRPKGIVLGQELSGVVEAIGKNVTKFKLGDEIFGTNGFSFGGYAEYKCASEKACYVIKPNNISFEEAAGASIGGLEAWHYLKKFNINEGDELLINGAGGSIGTSVLQIAKKYGAIVTVIDHCTKFDMLKSLGADRMIDYTTSDFTREDKTYDVIFDVIGKSPFKRSVNVLNPKGKYIIANPKAYQKLLGRIVSVFTEKKVYFDTSNHDINDLLYLKSLIEQGQLVIPIDRILPLDNIVEAHEYVESGEKKGNLIIKVR